MLTASSKWYLTLFSTQCSKTFEMKEDGSSRRVRCYPSCVLVLCWLFYHSSGNDHEEIDLLKSAHKEGAITSAVFFLIT